ncbi:MAG: histidinol-phosphatase [Candidatus Izemoplasmatales bacterium]|nr:histidinol-phosphatase [Candidatus Izemoplasmatales bacterium]
MPFTNQIMNNNYHTHMYLCRHADGDVKDYVEKAIELGFKSIGMSDHAPFAELKDRSVRMHLSDLKIYIIKCDNAIEKYKNKIKVYKALEIEYFPQHKKIYPEYLKYMDYLALGQHYIFDAESKNNLRSAYALSTLEHLESYVDTVVEAMSTGYFKFVCHPDLMLYNIKHFNCDITRISKKLIQGAIDSNVPLEINSNGIRKGLKETEDGLRYIYPRKEFWQLVKKMGARVIISSDAHQVDQLFDEDVIKAYQFANDLDIVVEEELMF